MKFLIYTGCQKYLVIYLKLTVAFAYHTDGSASPSFYHLLISVKR